MMKQTGIPSKKQVKDVFDTVGYMQKAKAIIECYEEIPCNPCSTSCPFDAIEIEGDINNIPTFHAEACTGCGICVSSCPGLAIIVVQVKDEKAWFKIPYEFVPLPKKNERWIGRDRSGKELCVATIEQVTNTSKQNQTTIVTVSVEERYLHDFITIRGKYEER